MATHKAVKLLTAARQRNHEPSLLALGKIYLEGGYGLPRSNNVAYHWLSRAAVLGNIEACRLIGDHIPVNVIPCGERDKAVPFFETALAMGSENARLALAELYLSDLNGVRGPDRVRQLLRGAADSGNPEAQLRVAMLMLGDIDNYPADEPYQLLHMAASSGLPQAMTELLNLIWSRGNWDNWYARALPGSIALPPCSDDAANGIFWFERIAARAADHLDAENSYRYGLLLLIAQHDKCVSWITRAARIGHAKAQYLMGLLHMGPHYAPRPIGTPTKKFVTLSYKKALGWLDQASQQGIVEATFAMAILYGTRTSSLRDPSKARHFLMLAAEQGHTEAQYRQAKALLRASGKQVTLEVARLARRSSQQGHSDAIRMFEQLVSRAAPVASNEWDKKVQRIGSLRQSDPLVAIRMLMGLAFGLNERETLLFEIDKADQGDLFQIQFHWMGRPYRRLVSIETAQQCAILEEAASYFKSMHSPREEMADTSHDSYQRFRAICKNYGIEWRTA